MARRPAPTPSAVPTPPLEGPEALAAADRAAAEALADAVASMAEEAPSLEELRGTPSFLDMLEELPQRVRDARGFKFKVYCTDRGPMGYLADSDWGTTPPTERAIAERYGPGSYRVTCQVRRNRQGGGNLPDITIRILPPRDPSAPAAPPARGDDRAWDMLDRLLEERREAGAMAPAAAIPDEPPAWLASLLAGNKPPEGIPAWLEPIAGKVLASFFPDPPAASSAAPGA